MFRLRCTPATSAARPMLDVSLEKVTMQCKRHRSTFVSTKVAKMTCPAPSTSAGASSAAASSKILDMVTMNSRQHQDISHTVSNMVRRATMRGVGASCTFSLPSVMHTQRRFNSQEAEKKTPEGEKAEKSEKDAKGEGEKAEGEKAEGEGKEEPPKQGFRYQFNALKHDMTAFPDIYNAVTLINFFLWTIFCLCSTGSNVEEKWWLDWFGIDATIMPTAWFGHSLLMNNFLSMSFAMMLVHNMCHAVMPIIGGQGLLMYCGIISGVSGLMMQAFNTAMDLRAEKQFGPWDFIAGLFVMQYLHQGVKPWQVILGFSGWVKYACCVGSFFILYYDYQPVICGTLIGLALCKTRFPPGMAAAGAAGAKTAGNAGKAAGAGAGAAGAGAKAAGAK